MVDVINQLMINNGNDEVNHLKEYAYVVGYHVASASQSIDLVSNFICKASPSHISP